MINQHYLWLASSLLGLLLCFVLYKLGKGHTPLASALGYHGSTVVLAIVFTIFGIPGPYSVHCIWFNIIMCLTHIGLRHIVKQPEICY